MNATYAAPPSPATATGHWQHGLPLLRNVRVTLRELQTSDARSLLMHMRDEDVRRYIAPPPISTERFARFIRWTRTQRRQGRYLSFGIVPSGQAQAVGIFQLWPLDPNFSTAEWGVAIGTAHWGTGVAMAAAHLVLDFAFRELQVSRLEARSCVRNHRGNGMLRKLRAVPEDRFPDAFCQGPRLEDEQLWSIASGNWRAVAPAPRWAADS